jgi:hypothetical protein
MRSRQKKKRALPLSILEPMPGLQNGKHNSSEDIIPVCFSFVKDKIRKKYGIIYSVAYS